MAAPMSRPHVFVKGTEAGLTFFLSEESSFGELRDELQRKVREAQESFSSGPPVPVVLHLGRRRFSSEREEELARILEEGGYFRVREIRADVFPEEESAGFRMPCARVYFGPVRSGEHVVAAGDLLVVGDVHGGAKVEGREAVYVLGRLAGEARVRESTGFIVASSLRAALLVIGDRHLAGADIPEELRDLPGFAVQTDGGVEVFPYREFRQFHFRGLEGLLPEV